ncbi:MAG TPA: N-acetyl-alpha-D-glucosaminyl L-malate synthase BshA [Candidatus Hydrogenedens sp.]|nr:N-acetyl-alpha-D-glucosaminyl L-malate synthase BshA [Candidatus Hydrogenedens sp.]HOL20727.1 N-acetyl-alpha-D-glucosaminyl L-malate synthase BshA [Candidatus Hydrogenedens sp.]HPP59147.1 N-acetyl-alpha-D-glucosaminyl L-malate synthase BshA [Candidatus Hydrogenedens sp.]
MRKKTQKLKIGISCYASTGGSGIVATELGLALAQRGHEVHFVVEQIPFRLRDNSEGVFCHVVEPINYPVLKQPPSFLTMASRIAEVVEENSIQLWHAHYAIPHASIALLAKEMLPPPLRFCLITTLHGTDITIVGADPSLYRVTKHAMENSCAITAVSDWLKKETEREFNLSKPIHRIYNFIKPSRFQKIKKINTPWLDKNKKTIMHISNFRAVKRVTDVIRVFAKVVERIDAQLVMVGEGPERISSVGVARQLGILNKIKYIGNYPRIEELLTSADLVIQPSEHESFGMVALEAMSAGVPVIATRSGGIQELIVDGVTGFLCEVGDIETMADWAIQILFDDKLKKEMGKHAKQRVREQFSDDKIIPQYEELYINTLNKYKS